MENSSGREDRFLMGSTRAGGLVAAAFGLAGLLGWIAGLPALSAFGANRIPMAPSTALIFLLFGAAIFLRTWRPENRLVVRVSAVAGSAGAILSVLFLALSSLGIHPQAEHLGLLISRSLGGAPLGHMSPLTAFCFLLAGFSFLGLISSSSKRPWRTTAAFLAAAVVLSISAILTLAYALSGPLLYGSGVIPPALTTYLAFTALGTALLASSGKQAWPRNGSSDIRSMWTTYALVLVLGLAAMVIVATGYLYFRNYQKHFRAEVESGLAAIAELKVDTLVRWHQERLGDADFFSRNDDFSALVRRFHQNPNDRETRGRLHAWLSRARAAFMYDRVFFMDARGIERISAPETAESVSPHLARDVSEVMRSGRVAFCDFHRDAPDRPVHLAVLAPIIDETDNGRALGVLALRIDPESYLYPRLKRWPTPSRTAETLLVRRDGDDVLFLNDLKFRENTALNLRIPIATATSVPAMAVMGREGIVEGLDYRDVPVIAALRAVPGSPWFMVARMDIAEVYAPLRQRSTMILILIVVLLLGAGASTGFVWRHQSARFYRQSYETAEELRKSEERYHRILDNMLEGFQVLDRDWRYVYLNDAAAEHVRRPKEELLGRTMMEAYPGIERTDMFGAMRRSMEERIPQRLENQFTYPDGSQDWFALIIQPSSEGISVLSLDVTERKNAEAALERSEGTLRALFDNARDGIAAADVETKKFVVVNEAICRMLGYSREEMLGLGVADIHPEEDLPRVLGVIERQIRGEIALAPNIPVKRKDGSLFYADVNSAPVELDGRACLLGLFRDVTERRLAESRIQHLNRVLRAIRDVNQLIVRERDRERLIRSACELLIRRRGYDIARIVLADENERPYACVQAGGEAGETALEDKVNRGELPPCCLNARQTSGALLITDSETACAGCPVSETCADRESMCVRLVHEDTSFGYLIVTLTEDVRADEEERGLFAEMAGDLAYALHTIMSEEAMRRSEQEREALESQLLQAQKMEAVGRLAGGVAHDFNNMLQTILGSTDMLLEDTEPEDPNYELMEEIKDAAKRSADLTRQLLAFARKQAIHPRVLDLNDTIANMLKMLGRLIGEDINLLWKPGKKVWPIKMDPAQIDQVLANLMVNARDAIAGVGKITIETGAVEFDEAYCATHAGFIPGEYALLAVSDDGKGMDRETVNHIFEPFFTTKPKGQGTGLGLSTVYGIVKQNDGFINVYSEPGRGTTFRIYLPRQKGGAEALEETKAIREKPTGTETVLLVEDDTAVLKLSKRLLEQLNYAVLASDKPAEAERMAAEYAGEIHLLVTDVVMPEMSGLDLWKRLLTRRKDLKCLFTSGYTADVITHHGLLEEGINFIQKPCSLHDLAVKIREVLDST